MTLLAKVQDSFQIGSKCVIVFKFVTENGRIRVKEQIQLRTPDGQVKETYIAAIAHVKRSPLSPVDRSIGTVSLPQDVTKQDVPPGTEIWKMMSSGENL
ncbi:MAG: hypothetical protein ACRD4E_17450 [Bryobacteraceae bacterium]